MKIEFINHSSLLIKSRKCNILCDPWYKGTAFADGWRLLYDQKIDIKDLKFDKIWISHEHPDHFSIPTLKSIKGSKSFLYQKTKDKKVKKYLEREGHSVLEMPNNKTIEVKGLKLTNIVTEDFDSCLMVEEGNKRFLNINDSQLDKVKELNCLKKFLPIDIIAIQFHYANWSGNEGDEQIPEFKRKHAVDRIIKIADFCKVSKILLFASYVYYCHEENFYWNKIGSIKKTVNELQKAGLKIIVPKPKTELLIEDENSMSKLILKNSKNIDFWENLLSSKVPVEKTNPVRLSTITESYNSYWKKLNFFNNLQIYKNTFLNDFNLILYVPDLKLSLKMWLFQNRIEKLDNFIEESSATISSDALHRALISNYGLGSITISSRIQFNYKSAYKFYFFFLIAYRNNLGKYLKNSISKDINLSALSDNGVLKPIFYFNKEAKNKFDKFKKLIKSLDENL